MTPSEEKQLTALNETLSKEIQIKCLLSKHEQSRAIQQFCETLSRRVPKIRVKNESRDPDEIPAIQIHDGLRYRAVPTGTEFAPFVEALKMTAAGKARLDDATATQLAAVDLPARMVLYVSPQCSFCPRAVRQLLPLLYANKNIHLTVIDALSFAELAKNENIQSVPTLVLEDQFRWTGTFETNEVVSVMAKRDPAALGPLSLEMMLKEGNAGHLAEMMLQKAQIFPAFYELLVHPDWPVRLGAMVVMEEIIEKNLDLALQAIEPLWRQFDEVDARVKGDMLYLFGQTGRGEIAPLLEQILNGRFEAEVKEAAAEALVKLNRRD